MSWFYFITVFLICLPGIYFMYHSEKIYIEEDDVTDSQRLIAHGLTALLFSTLGAYIVPKTEITQAIEWNNILVYGLGIICSIGHLFLYYFYLVPKLTRKEYLEIETHYANTGILSRVFYGGVLEEVMFRWGLLSLFLWLFQLIGINDIIGGILAIGISSTLFAVTHLPSIKLVASDPRTSVYVYTMIANVWVGIIAGVAFIQGSLLAAIMVHMLFHLTWWPIQRKEYNKILN
ncbi:type II CAAX prenyl endopeptidase Rce1 family protein [Oceanobacillus picturae]|uniref:CPBP family glutamic-type intramembrane protease n=1 Tax=Oceanobacillus picturae TaxID=171693 RepID=UPI000E6A1D5C|nr:CPBP family glutamic-type intramembrane protease [Oceanobacillus picturae]RIU92049.1 CPBP family intramembrane metalloprotease [Oceanobacillus picturae]